VDVEDRVVSGAGGGGELEEAEYEDFVETKDEDKNSDNVLELDELLEWI
jgi:hypothetical protein